MDIRILVKETMASMVKLCPSLRAAGPRAWAYISGKSRLPML